MDKVDASVNQNVDPANKTTYLFATIGPLTEQGGRISSTSSKLRIVGLTATRVGDVVTYADGSEAIIIDGAGLAAVSGDKPFSLVGSRLSNGDRITETLQTGYGIPVHDGQSIPGLLDLAYVALPVQATHRGA